MQPTLCSRCKKNIATVFITRMEGDKTVNEGLCLKCAKSLGLPQVNEMMQRMGITDEDLDNLNNEMMQAMDSIENVEDLPGVTRMTRGEPAADGYFPVPEHACSTTAGEPAPKEEPPAEDGSAPGRKKSAASPTESAKFLERLLHLHLNRKARGGQAGPGDRPGRGDRAGHPDPEPPPEEQPLPHRRARRGQDRHRRGPGPADRGGGCALQAAGQGGLSAGPDGPGGRHPVPGPV